MKKLKLEDFAKANIQIAKKQLLVVKGGDKPRKHRDWEDVS